MTDPRKPRVHTRIYGGRTTRCGSAVSTSVRQRLLSVDGTPCTRVVSVRLFGRAAIFQYKTERPG